MKKENKDMAITYCRVSTDEQVKNGASLQTQERMNISHAQRIGVGIMKIFFDRGESAKSTNRPGLIEMIKYCTKHKKEIQYLIVYKIDRLSRNTGDYIALKSIFAKLGITIISVTEALEDTPAGRFAETMFAASAQMDNETRAERCTNGMKEAILAGRYVWRAPIGYLNSIVNGKPNIILDPQRAPFVREIFEMILKDIYSLEEVRRKINQRGLINKSGTPLSKTYFHKIIRNLLYAGIIAKFGKEYEGDFPAIITKEEFAMVQKIIARGKKKREYKRSNPDFPLAAFVENDQGKKLAGYWTTGNGGRFPYYRFRGESAPNIPVSNVHEQFKQFIQSYKIDVQWKEFEKILANQWKIRAKENSNSIHSLKHKRAVLKNKLDNIVDKNIAGVISDDIAKMKIEDTKSEIERLDAEIYEVSAFIENIDDLLQFAKKYIQKIDEQWFEMAIESKKKLQWFLFPSGVQFSNGNFLTSQTALILQTEKTFREGKSSNVALRGIEPLFTG